MSGGDRPASLDLRFDRVADRYDETRGGLARGRAVARSVHPHLPSTGTVLEVGVGTGAVALGLRELGVGLVGVDLSRPMLERARERLGPSVVVADARRLPVRDESCAAVLFVWVLQLVPPADVLADAARVVAPGGRVVAVLSDAQYEADDELHAVIGPMHDRLRPGQPRVADVTAAGEAVGLHVRHVSATTPEAWAQSPAEEARRIEERTYSSLWNVTDDRWEAVVAPAVARLRALPDPERPRQRTTRHPLVVLERR